MDQEITESHLSGQYLDIALVPRQYLDIAQVAGQYLDIAQVAGQYKIYCLAKAFDLLMQSVTFKNIISLEIIIMYLKLWIIGIKQGYHGQIQLIMQPLD